MTQELDLTRPILELGVEDWYGLWELSDEVAKSVGANPDVEFRKQLREKLVELMDRGLLEAAMWSHDPPKPLTPQDVRDLALDSKFWESPIDSPSPDQVRVAATAMGSREYYGGDGR